MAPALAAARLAALALAWAPGRPRGVRLGPAEGLAPRRARPAAAPPRGPALGHEGGVELQAMRREAEPWPAPQLSFLDTPGTLDEALLGGEGDGRPPVEHLVRLLEGAPRDDAIRRHLEDGRRCAICLEGGGPAHDMVATPCRHAFHARCILRWARASDERDDGMRCPTCRQSVEKTSKEYRRRRLEGSAAVQRRRCYWMTMGLLVVACEFAFFVLRRPADA